MSLERLNWIVSILFHKVIRPEPSQMHVSACDFWEQQITNIWPDRRHWVLEDTGRD